MNELVTMQTLYDKKKNKNKRIFDCKISSAGGRKFQTNKYNSILALVHMFLHWLTQGACTYSHNVIYYTINNNTNTLYIFLESRLPEKV